MGPFLFLGYLSPLFPPDAFVRTVIVTVVAGFDLACEAGTYRPVFALITTFLVDIFTPFLF